MKIFYFDEKNSDDPVYEQYDAERIPCVGETVSIAEYPLDSANSESTYYHEYIVVNIRTIVEINHGNESRTNHTFKDVDIKYCVTLKEDK